jgi:hypothetical protein
MRAVNELGGQRSAKKNVAGKMITGGDTGEADGANQAIGEEGSPAMLAIPVGKDGGYGGCRHGMVRKESARMERITAFYLGRALRITCSIAR